MMDHDQYEDEKGAWYEPAMTALSGVEHQPPMRAANTQIIW